MPRNPNDSPYDTLTVLTWARECLEPSDLVKVINELTKELERWLPSGSLLIADLLAYQLGCKDERKAMTRAELLACFEWIRKGHKDKIRYLAQTLKIAEEEAERILSQEDE